MTEQPSVDKEESDTDRNSAVPYLFPRLSPEQYRDGLFRYLFIFMRLVFLALFVIAVWWVASALGALLFPLLASIVLAYMLAPLIEWLERRGASRTLGIALVLASTVGTFVVVGLFLVPPLVEQIRTIVTQLPDLVETIENQWVPWIEENLQTELPASVRGAVERYGEEVRASLPDLLERAGRWSVGAVSTTGQVLLTLFNLILVPLFTFYFLHGFERFQDSAVEWLPVRRRDYTIEVLARMDRAVGQWFRGQVQVAVLMGILFALGLSITFAIGGIDPKLGIAIGIISGLLNIVPYFGQLIAIILTSLVVLLQWPGFGPVLAIVAVFVLINLLEGYVIVPRVVGTKVDLSPIAVIILLLIGGELAGIVGILLIIPLAGAIKVILPDLLAIYRETAFYHGGIHRQKDDDH
ncbi:MAG: AI-2E family transporter [Persicimonas sp.]